MHTLGAEVVVGREGGYFGELPNTAAILFFEKTFEAIFSKVLEN